MRILFALISLLAGLALVFGGYRLARYLIPLWGFLAGLSLGGAIVADMAGTPFLATFLGIFIGVIMGLVLAAFAYLYFSIAVIVLVGALGYWAGSSFIQLLGFNGGLLSTLVGLAIGVLLGIFALIANAPKYVLIILTAVTGAVTAVGGILLLFNQIPLAQFSYSIAHATINNSTAWSIVTFALAIIGIASQFISTRNYELMHWKVDGHGLPPTKPHSHTPAPSHQ